MRSSDWAGYLAQFHSRRPGITEQVLRHAHADDGDAYDWLAAAIPAEGLIVDVACGNAPLWTRLPGERPYLGVDTSSAELRAATGRGVRTLARADAAALPLRDASAAVVTCSMALQIVTPLHQVLAEIGRVLRPGGHLIATVPAGGPLRAADLPSIAGLLGILGRTLRYPNEKQLRTSTPMRAAGLLPIADESRRYPFALRQREDADLFLASLYLPGLATWRLRAARGYLRALARMRVNLPVPIRRIVAVK